MIKKVASRHLSPNNLISSTGPKGLATPYPILYTCVMTQRIELETTDGVRIFGDISKTVGHPKARLLLLHMMPADRTSWTAFATRATDAGFTSLAIDLRGHGESRQFGAKTLDYQTMTDAEHQASIHDVEAALQFLAEHANAAPTVLVGASIGANLALQALTTRPEIPAAALLSPGLDYRGINILKLIRELTPTQELFMVASNDDDYSFETIRALNSERDEHTIARQISGAGHGTTMLERQPELIDDILEWLTATISNV